MLSLIPVSFQPVHIPVTNGNKGQGIVPLYHSILSNSHNHLTIASQHSSPLKKS